MTIDFPKSWRTSLSGVVAGLSAYVLANPAEFPHWAKVASGIVMSGALTSLGFAAKDAAVHSTEGEVKVATAENVAELKQTGEISPASDTEPEDPPKVPKW